MKRPRRTYRLHDDTQLAIEALAEKYDIGLGEVIEQEIGYVATQVWGRSWREQIRDRRQRVCATPAEEGFQPHAATAADPGEFGRDWIVR